MKNKYTNKIDPLLLNTIKIKSQIGGDSNIKVIVLAKDYNKMKEQFDKNRTRIIKELPFINSYIVEIPDVALNHLANMPYVRYISSDIQAHTQMNIASQVIGADKFHKKGLTGKGISVAIIDTGLYPHPDFIKPKYRIKAFIDFVNKKQSPYDDNGHGTFVTGVVAGNGYASRGKYKGIAPKANIVSLKTMNKNGGGDGSAILEAMQYVADHHKELNIKVLSMSLGAVAGTKQSDTLSKGAQMLWNKGIFVVAAAGNAGPEKSTITTPGVNPFIMTVGASDDNRTVTLKDDSVADFSSRGPTSYKTLKPEIVAPGVDIVSTHFRGNPSYTTMSGTSVATPMVAGAALLYYEAFKNISPDKIKTEILNNAVSLGESKHAQGKGSIMLM